MIPPKVHDTAAAQTKPIVIEDRHAQTTLECNLEKWCVYLAAVFDGIRSKPRPRAGQLAQNNVRLKRCILGLVGLKVLQGSSIQKCRQLFLGD
jgi:hypothetical protein